MSDNKKEMSKSNACLMYAVSFAEAEAKGIPRTQKLLCKVSIRTKRNHRL